MVTAVLFDYWNTLAWEGPDGLVTPRLRAWTGVLQEARVSVTDDDLERAHAAAFRQYEASWRSGRQFVVEDATAAMLAELRLDVAREVHDRLVACFDQGGRRSAIRLNEGVASCLERLNEAGVRLGIVCDVGLMPSTALRYHLERNGLLDLFGALSFSDETGMYKPEPDAFLHALRQLDVEPRDAAHVGDRRRTDIAGALALGMIAVRYRGVYDDPEDGPGGDIVVDHLADLPETLATYQRGPHPTSNAPTSRRPHDARP